MVLFKKFNDVVDACFGQKLQENYHETINEFRNLIIKHNIRITPKIHATLFHIQDFINVKQQGLGYYSEQASESVHHAYGKHFENFKINLLKMTPDSEKKMLRSVTSFNALRV